MTGGHAGTVVSTVSFTHKKVQGSSPLAWVLSRRSGCLPQSKEMHFRLIGDSKLPVGVNVSARAWLFVSICQNWWPVLPLVQCQLDGWNMSSPKIKPKHSAGWEACELWLLSFRHGWSGQEGVRLWNRRPHSILVSFNHDQDASLNVTK